MWRAWEQPGLGHLRLAVRDGGVIADGIFLGVAEGRPFRLAYEVRCDAYWRGRYACGRPRRAAQDRAALRWGGNWAMSDGRAVAYLEGCGYVHIYNNPNKVPIPALAKPRRVVPGRVPPSAFLRVPT